MPQRSWFGCQTCKTRRVKCDETLPFCKRCTQTGRKCDGPSKHKVIFVTPSTSDTLSPPKQLSLSPDLNLADRRALSFFVERAGPALGGELDHDFWGTSVLQLCRYNPLVCNAVLAVSTLYEKPLSNPLSWPPNLTNNFSLPEHRQAFKWYSQSLNGMSGALQHAHNREQLHLALTTCILFACIEFQQLNVINSMALMKCGYHLLGQQTTKNLIHSSPLIRDVLLPIFVRQTFVLMMHGHPLPQGWLPNDLIASTSQPSVTSLQDARTQLFLLMLNCMPMIKSAYTTFDPEGIAWLKSVQQVVLHNLEDWHNKLNTYVSVYHRQHTSSVEIRVVSLLKIYYLTTVIWLCSCLEPDEMIYDTFTPQFTALLDHAEVYLLHQTDASTPQTYNFEMRVLLPLAFTGWRCRIPHLRRRAIRLLKMAPAQESLFHRDVNIWAVRKIIRLEEGLGDDVDVDVVVGQLPSDEMRLRHVVIRWDAAAVKNGNVDGQSRPSLVYSKWMLEEDENGGLRELRELRELRNCVATL